MKCLEKIIDNTITKAVLGFCTLLGGIVAIGSIFAFFFPQNSVVALNKVIAVLEQRLPEARPPSVEFLEFWQSLDNDGTIQNTMLRYYNPSPTQPLENITVKVYHQSATGNYALLYEETKEYMKAESSRDVFDIKTQNYLNAPALLCIQYNDGVINLIPLSPEKQDKMVRYSQSGAIEVFTPQDTQNCTEAIRQK